MNPSLARATFVALVGCWLCACPSPALNSNDAGVAAQADAGPVPDAGGLVPDAGGLVPDAGGPAPDGGPSVVLPPSTAVVDPSVQPTMPGTATRRVTALVGSAGAKLEVVAGELLVITDDQARLDAFLTAHQGTVVSTTRFAELGLGDMPAYHHVRVEKLDDVDLAQLTTDLTKLAPNRRDDLRATDEATLRLLALAAHETRAGFTVTLNSLIVPQSIVDGASYEAAKGEFATTGLQQAYGRRYEQNAFNWPYMVSGRDQDIGVGDAWRFLAAADKLSPRVRLLIIDGGFRKHDDLPANTTMLSSWNVGNPASCGDHECPWHGTAVASAAASIIDNGMGTAGSGGPVVKLSLGQIWGEVNSVGDLVPRFFETLKSLVTLSGAIGTVEPLIISMSGTTRLPTIADAVITPVWTVLTAALRAKGVMFLAAAGNDGEDADRQTCPFDIDALCYEPTITVPCELTNVMCIGGLKSGSLERYPKSGWGSRGSVELFGPFFVWTVDPDQVVDGRAKVATLTAGTSVSTPFVAGIAALVWAANPSLGAGDVERIMIQTATPSPDRTVSRVINAAAAVRRALGPGAPRIYQWPQTTIERTQNQPLTVGLNSTGPFYTYDANLLAYASAPGPMTLTAVSEDPRDTAMGDKIFFGGLGVRHVVATVTDTSGATDRKGFDVNVTLAEGRLFAVLGTANVWSGQALYGDGRVYERTGPASDPASVFVEAPCSRLRWTVPTIKTPLGSRAAGSVVSEIDADAVVNGLMRTTARGCHVRFALDSGQHVIAVEQLGSDNATVIVRRDLPVSVGAWVEGEAPVIGSMAVTDSAGHGSTDPSQLDYYLTGVFATARYFEVQYSDPGPQSIEGLRFTVESLVGGQRLDLALGDQDHAESALLPSADSTDLPWAGPWLATAPEPSLIAVRASVTDNGLTAIRPYLVRLVPKSVIK